MPGDVPHDQQSERETLIRDYEAQRLVLLHTAAKINAIAGTACFPNEILARIFQFYVEDYRDQVEETTRNTRIIVKPFGFLKITHVCHRWREVAHHHAALWTRLAVPPSIYPRQEPANQLLLLLSRSCLLHISINGDAYTTDDNCVVFNEAHRIKTLEVKVDSCETEDATCLVVFTVDLPILDSITLKTEAYAEVNGEIGFPRDSCMSAFPSLKSLTMSGFTLSAAQRFIRPTITRLNLASARSIDSEGDWTSLIRLLSCLPRLQELVLFRMLFGWERDIATSSSQIHLDSLQKLVVTDHLDRMTRFFTAFSRFSPTLKDVDVHLLLPLRKTTSMNILSQELSRQWNRCSGACTTPGCKEFQFNALLIAFSPRRKGLETKINVCLPGNDCRCAMDKIGNSPSTTRNRKLTLSFSSTGRPSNLTFFKHLFSSLPLGSLLETHVLLHDSQDSAWTPDFDIIDGILFNAGVSGIIDIKGWNEGTLVKWLRRLMELPWESQPFKFSPSSWNHIHIACCTFDVSGSEPTTTEKFIQLSQEQPESFPTVWCEWNKKWGGRLALRMGALILHYDDVQTETAAGKMSYEE